VRAKTEEIKIEMRIKIRKRRRSTRTSTRRTGSCGVRSYS